eukprot:4451699-Pyramimonas_sp.AAC.1
MGPRGVKQRASDACRPENRARKRNCFTRITIADAGPRNVNRRAGGARHPDNRVGNAAPRPFSGRQREPTRRE